MSTIDHLLQNVAALDLPKLTEQQNLRSGRLA